MPNKNVSNAQLGSGSIRTLQFTGIAPLDRTRCLL